MAPIVFNALKAPRELTIGRFVIRRWLGSGMQGKVFEAFDPILERTVALKWLKPSGSNRDAAGLRNYSNEARIVAKLKHSNIVPLHEAGMHQGFPYLVFDYVEGRLLRQKMIHGVAMPTAKALKIFKGILEGMACAHAHWILHLDLSPANIMIDTAGAPHIMDFGLAKLYGVAAADKEDGELAGSPRYMSPEHFNGGTLTARSDVFALGLILHEMVTGLSPVRADSLEVLVEAIAERQLDLPEMDRAGLDSKLQALIARALSHAPEERFADAGEMNLALDELLARQPQASIHSTVQFLLNRMQRKPNFPALSNNLLEINRLTEENNQSSVKSLTDVILRDYAISNKLLQLANSSFYARSQAGAKTISDAIRLLGIKVIRLTCNGIAYLDAMKSDDRHLKDALISSFVGALLGRHTAIHLGRKDLGEEAFICGMFHRLGKNLSIFYFNEEFQEIEGLLARQTVDEESASTLVLGIPYSELGRAVAESWKFPEVIQRSIRHPGRGNLPEPADSAQVQQQIAAFANELCELAARSTPEQMWQRLEDFSLRFAGLLEISPDELIELLGAAFEKLGEFAPILGLDLRNSALIKHVSSLLSEMQSQAELEPTA